MYIIFRGADYTEALGRAREKLGEPTHLFLHPEGEMPEGCELKVVRTNSVFRNEIGIGRK